MSIRKNKSLLDRPNCIHFNLRKAMRTVTQHYDSILQPTGLRGTQFSILSVISVLEQVSITDLAERMVIDRTTLTRNLKPLESEDLIEITPGQDRRVKVLKLTKHGKNTLKKAIPYWKKAQADLLEHMGEKRVRGLLDDLDNVVKIGRSH